MNKMNVALFRSKGEAEDLVNRLRASGVSAQIQDPRGWRWMWFASKPSAGTWVEVPSGQFEKAEEFLVNVDARNIPLPGAIRCPECRSFRVLYPQFTRNSLLTNFWLGLASALGIVEKEYYCEDCHFSWPKEGVRPRRRQHMAPYYFIEGIEQTNLSPPASLEEQQKAA